MKSKEQMKIKIEEVKGAIKKSGTSRIEIAFIGDLGYNTVCNMLKSPERPVNLKTAKKFSKGLGSREVTDYFLPINDN